jgi:hypothetical protein
MDQKTEIGRPSRHDPAWAAHALESPETHRADGTPEGSPGAGLTTDGAVWFGMTTLEEGS